MLAVDSVVAPCPVWIRHWRKDSLQRPISGETSMEICLCDLRLKTTYIVTSVNRDLASELAIGLLRAVSQVS